MDNEQQKQLSEVTDQVEITNVMLLTYKGNKRRKVHVPVLENGETSSYTQILETLKKDDDFDVDSCELQILDPEFNEYVNLRGNESAKSGSRLQLIPKLHAKNSSAAASVATSPDSPEINIDIMDLDIPVLDFHETRALFATQEPSDNIISRKQINLLPEFPDDLKEVLHGKRPLSSTHRHDIISNMYHHLVSIKDYPQELYNATLQQFIKKFPLMRDKTPSCFETWRASLRYRFKRFRRMERRDGNTKYSMHKKNYGRPSTYRSVLETGDLPGEVQFDDILLMDQHHEDVNMMQMELQKSRPDWTAVQTAMTKTFAQRRSDVLQQRHTVEELFNKYPALKDTSEIYNEFFRITSKKIEDLFQVKLLQMEQPISKLAETTKKGKELLEEKKQMEVATNCDEGLKILSTIYFMTYLLKENAKLIFMDDCENELAPPTPTIFYSGNSKLNPGEMYVRVENHDVIKTRNIGTAIQSMFALYWVLNMEYPKNITKTLTILEIKLLENEENHKISVPVARILNVL